MNVRTLCLGSLMGGEATGYQIQKMFEDGIFSHFQKASFGSIYPALAKLTQDGLVTLTELEQENSAHKKIYRLTAEGRRTFLRMLMQTRPTEDRYLSDILYMLTFAEEIPIELTDALIDEFAARRELKGVQVDPESTEELSLPQMIYADDEEDGNPKLGCCFVVELSRAISEATLKFIRENKQCLLDELRNRKSRS